MGYHLFIFSAISTGNIDLGVPRQAISPFVGTAWRVFEGFGKKKANLSEN